ncbi:TPA: MarR family transcriptional regulator [Pseudomonas aeruginosa]|nr:MarR family transcriptional regulator [Pseudomonas aeruginosa]
MAIQKSPSSAAKTAGKPAAAKAPVKKTPAAKSKSTAAKGKHAATVEIDDALLQSSVLPAHNDESALLNVRIAFHIHDVSRMRRSAYDQVMKPIGITRAQWWVLAHLSRQDGMMQTQLADLLEVGKASVGTLLERLEAAKLIERRPDAVDKRAKRVYMLRSAHQVMKTLMQEEAKFNDRVLAGLTLEDREHLLNSLSRIKKALSEVDAPKDSELE